MTAVAVASGQPRVAYIIDGLGYGGAERLLAPTLRHLLAAGFAPRVCALQARGGSPLAAPLREMGVPVDLLPVRHLRDVTALPRLLAYLRRHDIQLVHTQLEFSNILGTLAAGLLRRPRICTLHTSDEPTPGSREARRIRLMWQVLRRGGGKVIAVSEGARRHHLRVAAFGEAQICTLYNGIDVERFARPADAGPAARAATRRQWGIPAMAPLIITVAVLRPPKGLQHMLAALPGIAAHVPDVHYLIVGDGDHRAALADQAAELELADRVIFAGARQDVPELLAAADLFVLPTLGDALPTVLAEAMAAGRPIVTTAVGGVPEMVADGDNGRLVPPADPAALADACVDILTHPALAARLGQNGRRIAFSRFNIETQAAALAAIYRQLLGA